MTVDGYTLTFSYDDQGDRISKKVAGGQSDFYLRDQNGRELAIIDMNTSKLKQVNIFGVDQIGSIDVTWSGSTPTYSRQYYVKDHLGSIRLVKGSGGTILSARNYYPYGELQQEYINSSYNARYKFTGKERDVESGLDYFGARYYNSELGRWYSVDPMASKYPGWSPYNFCLNNPISNIDPNGKELPVYVGVETEGLGHVYTVCVDDKTGATTAWSYGRYDGTSSGGSINPIGDGVLLKMEGDAAKGYVAKELQKGGGALYEIPKASVEKVNAYYQEQFDKSQQPSDRYRNEGKVIDTYAAPENTCVTKTVEGVTKGGGSIPNVTVVIPRDPGVITIQTPPSTPREVKEALNTVTSPKKELPK
jgi:RHS repeat-associated protein